MTDRDLDGLKGKVKTVEDRSQKIGPDGTPLEEPKIDWETTYNEDGDLVETMEFGVAKSRTTYFIYKGERVSKTEYIRDSPQKKTKLPANLPPMVEKKRGPYDYKLQYKYDKSGRIVQVNRNTEPAMLSSNSKYAYDESGKMISQVESIAEASIETTDRFEYDDSGNVTKKVTKYSKLASNVHPLGGFDNSPRTVLFSEYGLDKNGNWSQRKVTYLDKAGKVQAIKIEVRVFTYY